MEENFKQQLLGTYAHIYTVCRQNGDSHAIAMKAAEEVIEAGKKAAQL